MYGSDNNDCSSLPACMAGILESRLTGGSALEAEREV